MLQNDGVQEAKIIMYYHYKALNLFLYNLQNDDSVVGTVTRLC